MELFINKWRISESENKVYCADKEVLLQPLCMSLLLFLSQRPGKVVDRKQIIDSVWKGRVVSEDALNNSIRKIRKALDDDPKNPQLIETINKKGYRLIAAVENKVTCHQYFKKKRYALLGLAFAGLSCLCLGILLDVEIVTISPDMTESEKQQRYNTIQELTANGGHIIKLKEKS